ncbi:MAG: hypothetical protein H7Y32_20530, partial [Chloroflexales bacterium]|nr:hypothetical protein [Chloroflexales bacterium]
MKYQPVVRRWMGALLLATLCAWASAHTPAVLAWSAATDLPGIPNDIRAPKIAAEGNRFHVVFKREESRELYYSRGLSAADGSIAWQPPQLLSGDVSNGWNVSARAGIVHVAFADSGRRVLYLRNPAGGDAGAWGAAELVATVGNQVNELETTLDAAGIPYVQWGQDVDSGVLAFAYRSDSGGWVARTLGDEAYFYRKGAIVVSGSGAGATVHIISETQRARASRLAIVYARGTRDGPFTLSDFSRAYVGGDVSAEEPTLAIDRTTGALFAGFFSGKDEQFDLSFTYSTTNGASWAPATSDPLGSGLVVTERSPIVGFPGGAYVLLSAKRFVSGGLAQSGFYLATFSLQSAEFSAPTPVLLPTGTDGKNELPDLGVNQVAKAAVWARGLTQSIAYSGDAGGKPDDSLPNATLTVNGGASVITGPNVAVALSNIAGAPTLMQVSFDGDPTAATPVEALQTSFTRVLPPSAACTRSVAVVLIDAAGGRSPVLRAAFTVDNAVQASVVARNPSLRLIQGRLTGGDPAYTRVESFYLEINASAECTSLKQLRVGSSPQSLGAPFPLAGTFFANTLPLPRPAVGPNALALEVADALSNTLLYTTTLIYDPVAPVLATKGSVQASVPSTGPNILATLAFSGSVVTDTLYPAPGFWGVELANSRTPVADPATSLAWVPVAAAGGTANFTLAGWNLLTGI